MCKLGVISQERLKIEVKLLLSADRKSCMPHRLTQQRPFHASGAISAVLTETDVVDKPCLDAQAPFSDVMASD